MSPQKKERKKYRKKNEERSGFIKNRMLKSEYFNSSRRLNNVHSHLLQCADHQTEYLHDFHKQNTL
jgi:hypothetical protein